MNTGIRNIWINVSKSNDYVEATCPWGNRFGLHAPDESRFGAINLGLPSVEFDVPTGAADGIARFCRLSEGRGIG